MIKRKRKAACVDQSISGDGSVASCSDFFSFHYNKNFDRPIIERLLSKNVSSTSTAIDLQAIGPARFTARLEKCRFLPGPSLSLNNFNIPSKLVESFTFCNGGPVSESQISLYNIIGRYVDLISINEKENFTVLYCLHVLNHIIKTRKLIISNKLHLKDLSEKGLLTEEEIENARDQGLARPKVLILCPMKKDAYKVVEILRLLIFGDSKSPFVLNAQRFEEEFKDTGFRINDRREVEKEYRDLMFGNIDDCFRIGIGIAKKSLKLFTPFDKSDILLASPLGLRMIVGDQTEKTHESDFLCSVEILVIDKADTILMQNWEHVIHIMDNLNVRPKQFDKVDISRVRLWALDQHSKLYRQTLLFASKQQAEFQALFALKCWNFAGLLITIPPSYGVLSDIDVHICQELHRLNVDVAEHQSDIRFTYFKDHLLGKFEAGTVIFIPSYFDFVRVRNHLKRENESFVQLQEYAKEGKVAKARALFFRGERRLMFLTERFHFFRRYRLKGVKSIVFYQPPTNAQFYSQIINMYSGISRIVSCLIYSRFDAQRMANIFGDQMWTKIAQSHKEFQVLISK